MADLIDKQKSLEPNIGNNDSICTKTRVNDEDRTTGDTIYRQQAIDAVVSVMIDGADAELVEGIMELLPSAQPEKTCCGYDKKKLIAFAIACQRAGVDEEDLKCFAHNCESAWKVMEDEFNNLIKTTIENIIGEKIDE